MFELYSKHSTVEISRSDIKYNTSDAAFNSHVKNIIDNSDGSAMLTGVDFASFSLASNFDSGAPIVDNSSTLSNTWEFALSPLAHEYDRYFYSENCIYKNKAAYLTITESDTQKIKLNIHVKFRFYDGCKFSTKYTEYDDYIVKLSPVLIEFAAANGLVIQCSQEFTLRDLECNTSDIAGFQTELDTDISSFFDHVKNGDRGVQIFDIGPTHAAPTAISSLASRNWFFPDRNVNTPYVFYYD